MRGGRFDARLVNQNTTEKISTSREGLAGLTRRAPSPRSRCLSALCADWPLLEFFVVACLFSFSGVQVSGFALFFFFSSPSSSISKTVVSTKRRRLARAADDDSAPIRSPSSDLCPMLALEQLQCPPAHWPDKCGPANNTRGSSPSDSAYPAVGVGAVAAIHQCQLGGCSRIPL